MKSSWLLVPALAPVLFGLSLAAQAPPTLPAAPTTTTITPGTATATTVAQAGGITQVSTSTVENGNAYNQFTGFQIAPGDTVDLLVPSAATNNNLLNLVSGSATQIYGTLNSLLSDGKIGGNVFFADPTGIIVGASGVVNAGSLTLATPTSDFVNNFFGSLFTNLSSNTTALLGGTEPLNPDGLIAVLGQVNTAGPASLTAPTIAISGGIMTGAGAAQFGNLVNTAGLQAGQSISINGATITINGGLYGGTNPASLNAGTGDVTLAAKSSDTEVIANATDSITVDDAALTGNDIALNATAGSASEDLLGSLITTFGDTSPISPSMPFDFTGNVNVNSATSSATIDLGTGAGAVTLNALQDVNIAAEADTATKVGAIAALGNATVGITSATATADVGGNAVITAGGKFTLSTLINNNLTLNPTAVGPGTPSATASIGVASSTSNTTLAGAATAGNIGITADNENSFTTQAGAGTAANGIASIGVAVGVYHSKASATLSGTALATGADTASNGATTPALDLLATSKNTADGVAAASSVGSDSTLTTATSTVTGGIPSLVNLGQYLGSLFSSKASPESAPGSLGLAAAVAVDVNANEADATVSGSATAQQGTARIRSNAQDLPQISAGGTASGSTASLGGGVAVFDSSNTANTTVSGAVNGNQGVTIAAVTTLPNPFTLADFTNIPSDFSNVQFVAGSSGGDGSALQQDWNSGLSLAEDLDALLNPASSTGITQFFNTNLGLSHLVTSYVVTGASAAGGNGSSFGLAGSVNIFGITNQASTTVADGAQITAANNNVNVGAKAEANLINVAGMAGDVLQILKDKNPGAQGDGSLGGSYNGIWLTNSAIAAVNDGAQITATNGAVNVKGKTSEFLVNVTQAGDNAATWGVNGAFGMDILNDTAKGYIQSLAQVTAGGDVNVNAENDLTDFTIGGALGYGGKVQVGFTSDWNQINNDTEAYIGDPGNARTSNPTGFVLADGQVNVGATANESLYNFSLAAEAATGQTKNGTGSADTAEGGGSTSTSEGTGSGGTGSGSEGFGLGISGNVAINDITDQTYANINNAAQVLAAAGIGLKATDTSFAISAGLTAAIAAGGDSGLDIAGAFARNNFSKDTEAWAANALLSTQLQNPQVTQVPAISLDAESNGSLLTISAGGGFAVGNGAGLAGSVNNNVLTNKTKAGLGAGAVAITSGDISINAMQGDRVLSIAGAGDYAGNFGLGAALNYSAYQNTTDAYIDDSAQVNAGGNLKLTASTDEELLPIAAALGVSQTVSLGGSVNKVYVHNDTEATIGDATVIAAGNLLLGADDPSQALLIVGAIGGAQTVGVGVAGAISVPGQPLFDRTVKATIAAGAQVSADGNSADAISYDNQQVIGALLDATAEGNADTIVAGIGGAGDVGVAASLILNYFDEDVEATIAPGASINPGGASSSAGQEVAANASDSTQILDIVGSGAGSGVVSGGAAADVQFLNRTVQAELGGTINAGGNILADASLGGWDWSIAGAASFAGTVDLAGSGSSTFDTSQITADIAPDAILDTPDSVLVDAEDSNALTHIDGQLGGSTTVGVGAAVSLLVQQDSTTADIGNGATVSALGDGSGVSTPVNNDGQAQPGTVNGVVVVANTGKNLLTIAAGGQVTTGVSVAGSVVLNNISETTQAYVDANAVVNPASTQSLANPAQTINILANDGTSLTAGVGALGVGINIYGVGVGAAVNLEGPLSLLPSADSGFAQYLTSDLNGASAPQTPATSGFTKLTTAGVNNGATVNAADALDISALSSETLTNYLGSLGGGIAGVAGTVELDGYTPTTTAYFGNCADANNCAQTTGAAGQVGSAAIAASDSFAYNAIVGEVSAGGVGLGAAVLDSVVDANTSAFVGAFSNLQASNGIGIGSNFTDTFDAAALAGGAAAVAVNVPYASVTDESNNAAFVADDATVAADASSVTINATMQRTVAAVAAAAVDGVLGAGAEIENVTFEGANTAAIGSGDTVTGGDLAMGAQLQDTVPEYLPSGFATIPAISSNSIPSGVLGAAVGGVSGVGGQVTLTEDANDATNVGASNVIFGQGITLKTDDEPNLYAASAGLSFAVGAAGASIADINMEGTDSLGLTGDITAANGSLSATSNLTENLTTSATGIGLGLFSGDATAAGISDTGKNSLTQSGDITAADDAGLAANTARTANATSGSTNYGLDAAGVSFAVVNLAGSTSATLNGVLDAGAGNTAAVQASGIDTATADAVVNAGGEGDGIGAMAGSPNGLSADPSLVNPTITTTIAAGAQINGGTVGVYANDSSNLTSKANGGLIGAINIGLLDAEGTVAPTLTLNMNGVLAGGSISVQNVSNQTVNSSATSSESTSVASGYSTSDGANANPMIGLNLNGSVNASGDALVESDSTNTVNGSADANAGAFSVAAGGATNSSAEIDNSNLLTVAGSVASNGGNAALSAISNNDIASNNATGGDGSGIATGADTTATSNLTDYTHAELSGSLEALNGIAGQLAQGMEIANSNAEVQTSGVSGVSYIESTSTTDLNTDVAANLDGGASVEAGTYDLTATLPTVAANSTATGIAEIGLNGNGIANSELDLNLSPTVNIYGGASIHAATINVLANDGTAGAANGGIVGIAGPTAGTHSASGSAIANATLNAYVDPTANLDSGANIYTDALNVQTLFPLNESIAPAPVVSGVSAVNYVTEQVEETVDEVVGWIPLIGNLIESVTQWVTETVEVITDSTAAPNIYGVGVNPTSDINLNATIHQLNGVGQADLTIGANGQAEAGSTGLAIQSESANNVLVDSVVNNAGLTLSLTAQGGDIAGAPTIVVQNMLPAVNITNDSNLNLILQQISPIGNGNGRVPFNIQADSDSLNPNFEDNQTPTAITIANNGTGSVVFTNTIADQPGSLAVTDLGGSILSSPGSQLEANQISLDAPHGSIGLGGSLTCAICPGAVNGALGVGALNLQPDEVALSPTSAPIVPVVAAVAGGDVDLVLSPYESVPGETVSTPPSVNLTNLLAGGNLNLGLSPAQLDGTILVTETITLPFLPPITYQVPEAINGPAPDTVYDLGAAQWLAAGGNLNVNFGSADGHQVTLDDNGLIASGFQNIRFGLDSLGAPSSAVTADGLVNTSVLNYLQSPSGPPVLNDINLSTGGQVTFAGSGTVAGVGAIAVLTGESNFTFSNLDAALSPMLQSISDLGVSGSAISIFGASEPLSGTLAGTGVQLGAYGAVGGQISLQSSGGMNIAGSVTDPLGSIIATAAGDFDASGSLDAVNLTLNAADGAIGTSASPVPVEVSGELNATAASGIYLNATGDLGLGTLTAGGTLDVAAPHGSLLAGPGESLNAASITLFAGDLIGMKNAPIMATSAGLWNATATTGIYLLAGSGNLTLGDIATASDLSLAAPDGSLLAGAGESLTASGVTLLASGAVGSPTARIAANAGGVWSVVANSGIFLTAEGSFNAALLAAPNSNVQLTVNGGDAQIQDVQAAYANLALTQPGTSLEVANATIGSLLRASADSINLGLVTHANPALPLYLSLAGVNNAMAQQINVIASSAAPVIVEGYSSLNGGVTDAGDWLVVEHAAIGQAATFADNWLSLAVTNPLANLQYLTADFVGNAYGAALSDLVAGVTDLQPGQTFNLPATLTTYQNWQVTLLSRLP